MRNRLPLIAALLTFFTHFSYAQIVGTSAYLKGAYLEIGMLGNASFGAPAPPPGYHPHFGSLAEVYDYGHDGWTVGTPAYMGDYTYPGSPFEGWEVQYNGTARVQGYQSSGTGYATTGGATLTSGGITGYSNAGGVIKANWAGNTSSGNLVMRSITQVDTYASAVVMTHFFYNTGSTTVPQVYFWRSCDPDNDETWPGGTFTTDNVIDFQNSTVPNPTHKVSVTATGRSSTRPPLTMATKDCRAVACIYNFWGLSIGENLATGWAQTSSFGGTSYYNVGVNHPGDIGIGLIFKVGDVLPGDSAVISYAYIFNGPGGIDSVGALPDPRLYVNNVWITSFPDTLDACTLPGVDTFPVDIFYGSTKDWTWGDWTWTCSPGTGGLSSTRGTHVTININSLTGPTTYTVTGNDSGAHMMSCNHKQFVFTVRPCHFAWANDPCIGDSLYLTMNGDSTGASYFWYGPGGFTSTRHSPFKFPTTWADTGTYFVVKTVGTQHDTDYVHVILHPLPIVTLSSNIPVCGPVQNPLTLFANLDSIGETFKWTGPFGFTSTLQNPTVTPFDSSMQGTFVVTGTTVYGCKATSSINIWPGIVPAFDFVMHYGCDFDTVFFNNHSSNASTYKWSFGDPTPNDYSRNTYHIYNAHQQFYVQLYMTNLHCIDTITKMVDLRHEIHAVFDPTPDTLCLDAGALVTFANTSYTIDSNATYPASAWLWNFDDGSTDVTSTPSHTFNSAGIFNVTLTAFDAMGCPDSVKHPVTVVQLHIKSFNDTTLCLSQPLALTNVISSTPEAAWDYAYAWTEDSPNLDDVTVQIPHVSGFGTFTDVLTVTVPGIVPDGCPATNTVVIHSVPGAKLQNLTASGTIDYGNSVQLNASNEVYYYWRPNDGSLDNNNINNPLATPEHTTTYTVYGLDLNGCLDSAQITIRVDTNMTQDVPSGFTPNGDGNNDVFMPIGLKFQHLVEFRIFNRWGQEIFYSNSKDHGWDGTYHGQPQDAGVYSYMIIVARPGGSNIVYKGTVTLLR